MTYLFRITLLILLITFSSPSEPVRVQDRAMHYRLLTPLLALALVACSNPTADFHACLAQFERTPYALKAIEMNGNNKLNNGFKVLKSGMAKVPRTLVSGGKPWILDGNCRRLDV